MAPHVISSTYPLIRSKLLSRLAAYLTTLLYRIRYLAPTMASQTILQAKEVLHEPFPRA